MVEILQIILSVVIALIAIYTIRHYIFTLNRLFGKQRHPYIDIDSADWPSVSVLIPAHNEEAVIANSLEALIHSNYPREKLEVIVINDRSSDRTAEIINAFAAKYVGFIKPFHRSQGKSGKAAALKDATKTAKNDIIMVFDADYIPGVGLIKQLTAPFFDPEIGLVMGRVVPVNTGHNLLTRLLDMERAGGYQVDQQARMNMGLLPQYGGTVGGVRRVTLEDVGGWREDTLAEDTDITYRALLKGWKTVYQNRSECYEEVPQTWSVRIRQIMRWARGHNQSLWRYAPKVIFGKNMRFAERLDAILLLCVYIMSPILLIGWIIAMILFYMGEIKIFGASLPLFAIIMNSSIGNSAAFFQIASAIYIDGGKNRIRLLPFNFFNFLISVISVSRATFSILKIRKNGNGDPEWVKTLRFRKSDMIIG